MQCHWNSTFFLLSRCYFLKNFACAPEFPTLRTRRKIVELLAEIELPLAQPPDVLFDWYHILTGVFWISCNPRQVIKSLPTIDGLLPPITLILASTTLPFVSSSTVSVPNTCSWLIPLSLISLSSGCSSLRFTLALRSVRLNSPMVNIEISDPLSIQTLVCLPLILIGNFAPATFSFVSFRAWMAMTIYLPELYECQERCLFSGVLTHPTERSCYEWTSFALLAGHLAMCSGVKLSWSQL